MASKSKINFKQGLCLFHNLNCFFGLKAKGQPTTLVLHVCSKRISEVIQKISRGLIPCAKETWNYSKAKTRSISDFHFNISKISKLRSKHKELNCYFPNISRTNIYKSKLNMLFFFSIYLRIMNRMCPSFIMLTTLQSDIHQCRCSMAII